MGAIEYTVFGYRETWNEKVKAMTVEPHAWSCPLCGCVVTDRDAHENYIHALLAKVSDR